MESEDYKRWEKFNRVLLIAALFLKQQYKLWEVRAILYINGDIDCVDIAMSEDKQFMELIKDCRDYMFTKYGFDILTLRAFNKESELE